MSKGRKFGNNGEFEKAPSNRASTQSGYSSEYQFIDTYLNEQDKSWLRDNNDIADEYILSLVATLEEGYKLSLSFDGKSSRFLATFTCSQSSSPNKGKILTARGASPDNALFSLCYKLRHKSPDGLWGNGSAPSDFD